MRQGLKKSICDLESEGVERTEINAETLRDHITAELRYSCRYWTQHLASCKELWVDMDDVLLFLQHHFLHWVEVMCILGHAFEVVWAIERLQSLTNDTGKLELFKFLYDARRFILKNRHIADIAPLQLYCSGLIFAPTGSIVRKTFGTQIPKWISKLPKVRETWDAELENLEFHSRANSIAFSADGKWLASGGFFDPIRIWDLATGTVHQTFEDYDWTYSISFSPNRELLVSGSSRGVKVWDLATGSLHKTLEGHDDLVKSVAISPDGQWLASGSDDGTIRIWESWDEATAPLHQTIKSCGRKVTSVAFSPNGKWLASAHNDMTIRIWDLATGSLYSTLEGHYGKIKSVVFAPNRQLLASSSYDHTIKFWDPVTDTLHQPFKSHDNIVNSIALSPDGKWLVSGSSDETIKVWDQVSGTLHQTLEGHNQRAGSVSFSSDGKWLVSGFPNETIKVWDLTSGTLHQTLRCSYEISSSNDITSVSFSLDSQWLASGDSLGTIGIWNLATGTVQQTFDCDCIRMITSVAFSPDGKWLVSGSIGANIKVWDLTIGTLHQALEVQYEWPNSVGFSLDGPYLQINLGTSIVKSFDDSDRPIQTPPKIELCIRGGEWVSLQGRKVLWLPKNHRPLCTAIRNGMLAMGHESGHISLLEFCL